MKIMLKKNNIKPSNYGSKLILILILWYILAAVMIGFFGAPKIIIYLGDVLNFWLLLNSLYKFKADAFKMKKNSLLLFMVLFMISSLFSSLINFEHPLLVLWGIRQNFRYFFFFFSCIIYLRERDIHILLKIIAVVFWISVPLCVIEALFISYPFGTIVGDFVGGVYYGIRGVNAPLNVILVVYCTYILNRYFENKSKLLIVIAVVACALLMAALSELKVFLVEIVIITLLAMLRSGVSIKSVALMLFGIVAFSITITMFVQINGQGRSYYTSEYLTINGMIENIFRETGYDGTGDLNRFNAIPILISKVFNHNIINVLFGVGLGNADYSLTFDVLQSGFYNRYSFLHYQWFSTAFVFVETGIIGLFFYLMIFISAFIVGVKRLNKGSNYRKFYLTMVIMMIIMIIYNPSLRNEQCGFILYFILAIPFSIERDNGISSSYSHNDKG